MKTELAQLRNLCRLPRCSSPCSSSTHRLADTFRVVLCRQSSARENALWYRRFRRHIVGTWVNRLSGFYVGMPGICTPRWRGGCRLGYACMIYTRWLLFPLQKRVKSSLFCANKFKLADHVHLMAVFTKDVLKVAFFAEINLHLHMI